VREGAKQAMDQGINSYTRAEGLAPIRQAIAEKMQRFNGVAATRRPKLWSTQELPVHFMRRVLHC